MMRLIVALALGACLTLSGCAATSDSTYPPETASLLQSSVLAVTEASAASDPGSALARLNELEATLLDERARGAVDDARFDSVSAAIALVRTDLEAAIASQVEVVTDDGGTDSGNTGDTVTEEPGKPGKPEKPDKPGKPGKNG